MNQLPQLEKSLGEPPFAQCQLFIVAMAKPGKIEPHGCRWSLPHFIKDREVLFGRGRHLELSRLNNGTWLQKHTHTENGGPRPSWTQIDR